MGKQDLTPNQVPIIRKLGTRFLVDPYTQPQFVKLLAFERVGGGVNNFEAIKLVKFANS